MRFKPALAGVAALCLPLAAAWAQAQEPSSNPATPADISALLKRIDEQDQRIKALEQKLANPQAAGTISAAPPATVATVATPAAPPAQATSTMTGAAPGVPVAVTATAGPSGYSLQTADGSSSINFHGNLAVDGRYYSSGAPSTADTWLLRQVRPYIDGTIDKIFDYRLVPDFGNGKTIILDAYTDARIEPWFVVQVGKFKGPVGLERLQFSPYNRFIELGLPSDLVPNRDLGLQFAGDVGGGVISYAFGAFDGTLDGASTDASASPDVDNDYGHMEWEGRIFARPFAHSDNDYLNGLGFGVGGTHSFQPGAAANALLATYKTAGQQTFFTYRTGTTASFADGEHTSYSPQFYYYVGSFGLLGEYADVTQDVGRQVTSKLARTGSVDSSAWQLSAALFLTGEKETYFGFTPRSPFQVGGPGWGAFELVARYNELQIDEAAFAGGANSFASIASSARQAKEFAVGVNWWFNQNLRWMVDFEDTQFEGGATTGNRPDERALLTRFFLAF